MDKPNLLTSNYLCFTVGFQVTLLVPGNYQGDRRIVVSEIYHQPGKLRMKLPTVRVRTTGTVLVEMVDKNGFLEQNQIIGFVSPLPPRDSYIGFGFLQRINPFKSMKPLGTPRDLPYFFDFIDYSRAAGK